MNDKTQSSEPNETFNQSPQYAILGAMMAAAHAGGEAANERFVHMSSELGQALAAKGADTRLAAVVKDAALTVDGYRDLLTLADQDSDAAIRLALQQAYPDIPYVSEESEIPQNAKTGDMRFLVDPIDGTYNFAKGKPDYSVTVAYQVLRDTGQWETLASVVYDPQTHFCCFADSVRAYHGIYGVGADEIRQSTLNYGAINPDPPPFTPESNMRAKKIEVALYKSEKGDDAQKEHAQRINALGQAVRNKVTAEGTLGRTYSTAQVIAQMTFLQQPDCVVLGGDSLNAWDVDAALHIAEKAGAHISRPPIQIMGEPFVLVAKSDASLQALEAMIRSEAKKLGGFEVG